jgi:ribosomal protein L7/L12
MSDWIKNVLGDDVDVPPVSGITDTFEVPPLSIDIAGAGGLLDSVPPVGGGTSGEGELLASVPPVGEMPAVPENVVPGMSTSRAAAGVSVYPSPASGAPAPGIGSQPGHSHPPSGISAMPRGLAAPKPVEQDAEEVSAAKPVERHAEAPKAAKPVERHGEALKAPKPVVQHHPVTGAALPAEHHRHESPAPAAQPQPPQPPKRRRTTRRRTAPAHPAVVDVLLISVGDYKSEIIQIVRELLGTKTKRAKKIVKAAPVTLMRQVAYATAEQVVKRLRDAGADAELNWEGEQEASPADVILHDVGSRKISVIKVVRDLTGLGLAEAKDLVDSTPAHIARGVSVAHAREMVKQLRAVGATVEALE